MSAACVFAGLKRRDRPLTQGRRQAYCPRYEQIPPLRHGRRNASQTEAKPHQARHRARRLGGCAGGAPAGDHRQRPGHHRHPRRHGHRHERRGAAWRHRHGAQRGHRLHPQRAVQRGRRLPDRVPPDRALHGRGHPGGVQDREPRRDRPQRERLGPRRFRSGDRRGDRDGVGRGRLAAGQHRHLRHLQDHRRCGDPVAADRGSQRLLAARSDPRCAVQQQRRGERVGDDQLAQPRLPRAAHADQRRRRRRHWLGELLSRRRHQHDGAPQHRQHPAEPGRDPGVQGPDQRLQRRVRAVLERHHQRHHQGRRQSLPRLRVRVLPRRQPECE